MTNRAKVERSHTRFGGVLSGAADSEAAGRIAPIFLPVKTSPNDKEKATRLLNELKGAGEYGRNDQVAEV